MSVDILGVLLPLALVVAFSSVPIMVMIVILLSPRSSSSGISYLIGYAVGLAAVTIGFALGIRALPTGGSDASPVAMAIGEVVLGAGCVFFAIWTFVRARRRIGVTGAPPAMPAWLRRVGGFGPASALATGLVLNLRPKALALATAAGLAFAGGELNPVTWAIDLGFYLAIGLSTVAAPVITVWRSGERARAILERARLWLERNSYIVTSVVLLMIGTVLIGYGLSRL